MDFGENPEDPDDPEELKQAVQYLQAKRVIDGSTYEEANVEIDLLRQQLSKIAFRGLYSLGGRSADNLSVPSDNYPTVYSDLATKTADNAYYYQAAKALLYLEYGDGVTPFDRNRIQFDPGNKIARIHVLKVLLETFNIKPDASISNPFPGDANVTSLQNSGSPNYGYIAKAYQMGLLSKPYPYRDCTRGEAFLMLYRIMKKIEAGTITDPAPQDTDYFQPLNTTLATVGLGVGMQMGNFQHYTKTSFALNGVVPLAFAHTYNSYSTTLPSVFYGAKTVNNMEVTYQPLGDGWSHNYHSFITVVGSLDEMNTSNNMRAIVHWGGGSIDVYKSENGQLVPESMGIYDDISLVDGEVLIKSKSQVEYRFSRQGATGASVLYLYSIKDRNNNTLTINYEDGQNGNKRISSVSDGQRALTFYYEDGTDLLREVKDPLNRSVSFTYFDNVQTGKKQLETFTDAEGHTTTYVYKDQSTVGASKLLSGILLPKGNYVENQYDQNRRLTQTVRGVNGVPTTKTSVSVAATYGSGNISTQSQVDVERGSKTTSYHYTYNGNNVVTGVTGDMDMFVNRSYGNSSHPELPTSIENNSTNVSNIEYDAKGNVLSITVTGDGELTTTMTYDTMNNLTSVTDPKNNTTTYNYDGKGNLVEVVAPVDGISSKITNRDNRGLPTEVKNPMGVVTKFGYNRFGNLETVSLPALGLSSSAEYDDASRLKKTTDAMQRSKQFEYNNNDFLISEKDAMNHITSYGYDANDNLTTITNAKGGVTTMTYDNATDWLRSVEFAGAKKQYNYNIDGTLDTYIKPDNTQLTYSYDDLGRVTNDGVNSYDYDEKLRLQSVSDGSRAVVLDYDGFNRIKSTSYNSYSNSYGYDANGNRTNINGVEYEYDGLNRMKWVKFNGKYITYTYRKDSQLDMVSYPNGMTTQYGYDEVGRLTSKSTKLSNGTVVASYSFELDSVGNITEQTTQEPYGEIPMAAEDVSYSYNEGNRIVQAGSTKFEFDKNGNTKKRGNLEYDWDVRDRLTNDGSKQITYDPLGLIASYGNITFKTDPMGIGNVIYDSKSGANYIYGLGLEARVVGSNVSYYVTDMRGSVVAIVDDSGNITHKYQYDEFGKVTQKEEPAGDANYNPFQYVGKYGVMYLSGNLYYMRARHYDPTIGRFLSEDPIWSTNLYPYAENNPIMGIDPRGEVYSANMGDGFIVHFSDGKAYSLTVNGEDYNWNILSLLTDSNIDQEKLAEIIKIVSAMDKYELVYNEETGSMFVWEKETRNEVILSNSWVSKRNVYTEDGYLHIERNSFSEQSADEKAIRILKKNFANYKSGLSDYTDNSLVTLFKDVPQIDCTKDYTNKICNQ